MIKKDTQEESLIVAAELTTTAYKVVKHHESVSLLEHKLHFVLRIKN